MTVMVIKRESFQDPLESCWVRSSFSTFIMRALHSMKSNFVSKLLGFELTGFWLFEQRKYLGIKCLKSMWCLLLFHIILPQLNSYFLIEKNCYNTKCRIVHGGRVFIAWFLEFPSSSAKHFFVSKGALHSCQFVNKTCFRAAKLVQMNEALIICKTRCQFWGELYLWM